MSDIAIRTEELTKIYIEDTKGGLSRKKRIGIKDLTLEVQQGEVFAFLGPNGAGKTTTIKLLTRLLYPTHGTVWIFEKSNHSRLSMQQVGYLPEQPILYGYLSGKEFLDIVGRLYGMTTQNRKKQIQKLIEKVGLGERADSPIRGYSRGMVQRLGLAQALINDPDLLILDEPLSNLDPIGRKEIRDLILELKKQGKSIFFSSHILSDAEMVADRVGILNKGKLVNIGKLNVFDASRITSIEVTFRMNAEKRPQLLLDDSKIIIQDNKIMIQVDDENKVQELIKKIDKLGGSVISVIPQKKSLEDFFMMEVGR